MNWIRAGPSSKPVKQPAPVGNNQKNSEDKQQKEEQNALLPRKKTSAAAKSSQSNSSNAVSQDILRLFSVDTYFDKSVNETEKKNIINRVKYVEFDQKKRRTKVVPYFHKQTSPPNPQQQLKIPLIHHNMAWHKSYDRTVGKRNEKMTSTSSEEYDSSGSYTVQKKITRHSSFSEPASCFSSGSYSTNFRADSNHIVAAQRQNHEDPWNHNWLQHIEDPTTSNAQNPATNQHEMNTSIFSPPERRWNAQKDLAAAHSSIKPSSLIETWQGRFDSSAKNRDFIFSPKTSNPSEFMMSHNPAVKNFSKHHRKFCGSSSSHGDAITPESESETVQPNHTETDCYYHRGSMDYVALNVNQKQDMPCSKWTVNETVSQQDNFRINFNFQDEDDDDDNCSEASTRNSEATTVAHSHTCSCCNKSKTMNNKPLGQLHSEKGLSFSSIKMSGQAQRHIYSLSKKRYKGNRRILDYFQRTTRNDTAFSQDALTKTAVSTDDVNPSSPTKENEAFDDEVPIIPLSAHCRESHSNEATTQTDAATTSKTTMISVHVQTEEKTFRDSSCQTIIPISNAETQDEPNSTNNAEVQTTNADYLMYTGMVTDGAVLKQDACTEYEEH